MRKKGIKITRRYRLTFISENTLNTLWTLRLSRSRAWLLGALCVAAIGALLALLFGLTPLGSILPGYMKPSQRRVQIENGMRLDSLMERQEVQSAWIANIEAILTDSVTPERLADAPAEVDDTLLTASAREREFVEKWTERERYNLSAATPAATSAMSFREPLATILRSDTISDSTRRLQSTRRATVMAIYAGTVVDSHIDISNGRHTIIIQHPMDFVSRYEGLAHSFVSTGQRIQAGAAIGLLDDDGTMTLQVFH